MLDRLGRKGLEVELFRMQLQVWYRNSDDTTNEHADDDSLNGRDDRISKDTKQRRS